MTTHDDWTARFTDDDPDPTDARAELHALDLGRDSRGRDLLGRLLDDDDRTIRSRVAGLRMWLPTTDAHDDW